MKPKIDFLTIIYQNYELLDLQLKNFQKRFDKNDYRLIIVDNTPNHLKQKIETNILIDEILILDSHVAFDGWSHGRAIEEGLKLCTSDIICIFDSDFFFLQSGLCEYVINKFEGGYKAVGAEWNDGCDTYNWVVQRPHMYENIPCVFGAFYDKDLVKSQTFVITEQECKDNIHTGFIEVGCNIRKYILDNNIKTMAWKGSRGPVKGNCFFRDEKENLIGYHVVQGSFKGNLKEHLQPILGI
jgi:hypothetical protein